MSFANQALSVKYIFENIKNLKKKYMRYRKKLIKK